MPLKRISLGILTIVLIAQALVNLQVIYKAKVLRVCDEAHYLEGGLHIYYTMFDNYDGKSMGDMISEVMKIRKRFLSRPPALFVFQAMAWRLVSFFDVWSEKPVIWLINTLFLFVLAFSCYGIGSLLCGKAPGLMAAVLTVSLPIIFQFSRTMMTDLPLTALTCLSVYLLIKTDHFRSFLFSLLLGLALSITQLTKETFVLYFLFPLLYYIYRSFVNGFDQAACRNIIVCFAAVFLAILPVYLGPTGLFHYYCRLSQLSPIYPNSPLFYIKNFSVLLGYPIFIFTILLFIKSILNIRRMEKLLLLWFFAPLMVLSALPNQVLRFAMPILPAYCLIVSHELFKSRLNCLFKRLCMVVILSISLFQFAVINYMHDSYPAWLRSPLASGIRSVFRTDKYYTINRGLLEVFKKEKVPRGQKKGVLCLFGLPQIFYPLEYKFIMKKMPFVLDCCILADGADAREPGTYNWESLLLGSDYLLDKDAGSIGSRGSREDIRGCFEKALMKHRELFEVIAYVDVPDDGSRVVVYRKKESL